MALDPHFTYPRSG